MSEFQPIADELEARLRIVDSALWEKYGQSPLIVAIVAADAENLCKSVAERVGNDAIDAYFRGSRPGNQSPAKNIYGWFIGVIESTCTRSDQGMDVDKDALVGYMEEFAKVMRSGVAEFAYLFRVANVDIPEDFDLAEGIRFSKLSPDEVLKRYPLEHRVPYLQDQLEESWSKHGVEAIITAPRGTWAECQKRFSVEATHAAENAILHTFLLSGVSSRVKLTITHLRQVSTLEVRNVLRDMGFIAPNPYLLTSEDIGLLKNAFRFMKDAEDDDVLTTALDRCILGLRQDTHHRNRVNEPNWDKVVDYVIAMETLFTTVNGSAPKNEPTYRFSINGASLIAKASGENPHIACKALKELYALRSTVVHGGGLSTVPKSANNFIRVLGIDDDQHQHSLGRLMIICKKTEDWLRKVLFYSGNVPKEDRPYKKAGGWEELLWGAQPGGEVSEEK